MEEDTREQEDTVEEPLENSSDYPPENDTLKNEEVDDEPDSSESEKTEKSEKEIKSLLAQKEHWRKKALDAEAKAIEAKPKVDKPKTPVSSEDEWKHKVEFLLENRDVSDEEFEHLAAVALRRSGSITIDGLRDAQKQEKDYITYKRKKLEDKKKVPGSTSTGFQPQKKSAKEISEMTAEEFKAFELKETEQRGRGI